MSKRVLIITAAFPPWGGGGVIRMAKLAKYLPAAGWTPVVITSDERNPIILDRSLLDDLPTDLEVRRIRGPMDRLGGVAVGRVAASNRGRMGKVARPVVAAGRSLILPDRWVGWSLRVGRIAPSESGPADAVISSGPPHSVHLGAERLARRLKAPWVADLRDDWAGRPFGRRVSPWAAAVDRMLERRLLARAEAIVVVSEPMRADLIARARLTPSRVHVIPNGFDPDDLDSLPERQARQGGEPVRFLYAGRLVEGQVTGRFFDAFNAVAKERKITLELVGMIDPTHIAAASGSMPDKGLWIEGPISHREALERAAVSDVLVVFTDGGGSPTGTMTGKVFEALALRRPILLIGSAGSATDLVLDNGAGVASQPEDLHSLERAIVDAERMARDPAFHGANREVVESFNRRNLAADWASLLDRAVEA